MITPLKKEYPITQIFNDYRYRSSYIRFGLLGHNGVDYGVPEGTEVIAPHDGKIVENTLDSGGYGNYIKIENDKEFSVLAHFKTKSSLAIGKEVKQGDLVGLSGNTGNSTGPHLHWGYCYKPRNKDNGFNGYVDQQLVMRVEANIDSLKKELDDMRASRDKWKASSNEKDEIITIKDREIATLEHAVADCRIDVEMLQNELKKLKDAIGNNKSPLSDYSMNELLKELLIRFKFIKG